MKKTTEDLYHPILHWRDFRLKVFIEGIGVGIIEQARRTGDHSKRGNKDICGRFYLCSHR